MAVNSIFDTCCIFYKVSSICYSVVSRDTVYSLVFNEKILFYRRAAIPIVLHSIGGGCGLFQKNCFANTDFRPGTALDPTYNCLNILAENREFIIDSLRNKFLGDST